MAEVQTTTPAREYETIYVLRPDAGREASEKISERVRDVISKQRGALTRVENWGFRKLAYPVRKHSRGVYVYLKYLGDGALVSELERSLRLQDTVLKFQTVKLGDKPAALESKPEDVQFEHLDALADDGGDESMARSLGLEGGRMLEDRSEMHRELPGDEEDDFGVPAEEPDARRSEEN